MCSQAYVCSLATTALRDAVWMWLVSMHSWVCKGTATLQVSANRCAGLSALTPFLRRNSHSDCNAQRPASLRCVILAGKQASQGCVTIKRQLEMGQSDCK